MSMLRADEVRVLLAAQVTAIGTLTEMAEPYWLARRARSPVHRTFVVGLGKSQPVDNRQRVEEGVLCATTIKVLAVVQLEHKDHLAGEDTVGELRDAICKRLVRYQHDSLSVVWVEDAEVSATDSHVWLESQFTAIHQKPLE